jgi:hypothetical protein
MWGSAVRCGGPSVRLAQRPQLNITSNLRRMVAADSGTYSTSHSEPTM